jgi:PP-loop superfamily ATP-utilizing enzyme
MKDDICNLTKIKDDVAGKLKEIGYENVIIDPKGYRTGSMNESRGTRVDRG